MSSPTFYLLNTRHWNQLKNSLKASRKLFLMYRHMGSFMLHTWTSSRKDTTYSLSKEKIKTVTSSVKQYFRLNQNSSVVALFINVLSSLNYATMYIYIMNTFKKNKNNSKMKATVVSYCNLYMKRLFRLRALIVLNFSTWSCCADKENKAAHADKCPLHHMLSTFAQTLDLWLRMFSLLDAFSPHKKRDF